MSKTIRIRRTPDQWRELIAEQAASGRSQETFCKHKGLALSTFANWKRRLGSTPAAQKACEPGPSSWIDLSSLGVNSSAGWTIELDLGDGVCLRLRRS